MNRIFKTASFVLVVVLLVTCLSGCAQNSLLSQAFSKNNTTNNDAAASDVSTKDKIDKKNDEERLEGMKSELANVLIESDKARLDELTIEEIENIYKMKNNMLSNMKMEFNYNKVTATVDSKNATVTFKMKSFFHDDDNTLASEGEKLLTRFLQVYTFIIYNTKYENMVDKITLEYNAAAEETASLAQSRLATINDYANTTYKSGIATNYDGKFKNMLSTKLYPYDGTEENKGGSVTFRLKIKLDYQAE